MKATFYCDESGNTGTNWLDPAQPFFIYGGWLILDEKKSSVISEVSTIFKKYPGTEIKSTRFFKMGKANDYFKRLFDYMLSVPAFPIFTISYKSYTVALKIVETFFDPAYNHSLKNQIIWDIDVKKQISEVIKNSTVIFDFGHLIHSGKLTLNEMRKIKRELSNLFLLAPNISNSIKKLSDRDLQEMLDEFNTPNTSRTLTIPSLNLLMQLLQKFSEICNIETAIVHDNIRGYDDLLEKIRKIYLSKGKTQVLQSEYFQWYSKLPNISKLNLVDSKDNLLIQISDLLCGFLLRCFQKVDKDTMLSANEKEIMQQLFVLHDELFSWSFIFPEKLTMQYLKSIELSEKEPPPINEKILDAKFLKYLK